MLLTGGALLWLLMRAFAAGCTALTGVEAISNGIPAFKQPESKNAATTLTFMAFIMAILILGSGFLAYKLNAHPAAEETLLSAIAGIHSVVGSLTTSFKLGPAAYWSWLRIHRSPTFLAWPVLLAADRFFRANSQAAATAWSFPMALSFLRCWPASYLHFSKATNKQCSRSSFGSFYLLHAVAGWDGGSLAPFAPGGMKQSERSKKKQKSIARSQQT